MAKSRSVIPSLKPLGENIRAVRRHLGLSQYEFAELLGVTQNSISNWERSSTAPDAKNIMMICYKCGVSADRLLGVPKEWRKIK